MRYRRQIADALALLQTTSEWTLDYPPFFAYFERFLSFFAYIVDPAIVALDNLNHDSWSAIAFQRSTVIASELVLATAAIAYVERLAFAHCR